MEFAVSRILVPVDFSSHSESALRHATALAERFGASVELLHVVEDTAVGPEWASEDPTLDLSSPQRHWVEDARHRLTTMTEGSSVPMTTAVSTGPPAQIIAAFARAGGTGLIVMGTHGRTGLAHMVVGSVAERVIRNAPCPVLTVRDPTAPFSAAPALTANAALLRSVLGHSGASRE